MVLKSSSALLVAFSCLLQAGAEELFTKVSRRPMSIYPVRIDPAAYSDGEIEAKLGSNPLSIPVTVDQPSGLRNVSKLHVRAFRGSKESLSNLELNFRAPDSPDCYLYRYTDYAAQVNHTLKVSTTVSRLWLYHGEHGFVDQRWTLVPIDAARIPHDSETPTGLMLIQRDSVAKFFESGIEVIVKRKGAGYGDTIIPVVFHIPQFGNAVAPYQPAQITKEIPNSCYELTSRATVVGQPALMARVGNCSPVLLQ